jgi:hypothetical protein
MNNIMLIQIVLMCLFGVSAGPKRAVLTSHLFCFLFTKAEFTRFMNTRRSGIAAHVYALVER